MKNIDHNNGWPEVETYFNWQVWKEEVILSKPKAHFDVEGLREKYADFNSESKTAIKNSNQIAKVKCKAIVSGQKVHMLASLPHEKHSDTFNWEQWLSSGLKALKKRSEHTQNCLIKELAMTGQLLPVEDQRFYAECMEHFLLNGLKNLYNGFYSDLTFELKDVIDVNTGSEQINAWANKQKTQITEFFY